MNGICHDARVRGVRRGIEVLSRLRGYFPLTARGVLVGAFAAFALRGVAYAEMDFVVLVLGYVALGLLGLGLFAVLAGALFVRLRLPHAQGESRLLTDRALPTYFELRALRHAPLLELSAELASPRFERSEVDGREHVRASHRGIFEEVTRELVVRDAFGLAELRFPRREGSFFALPHLGKLSPSVELLSLTAGDDLAHPHGTPDGDRIELRRYVPGDPARFIHWKIFARSGELVVRMPEHALSRADRVAVYFIAGEGDEASAAVTLAVARAAELGGRVVLGVEGAPGALASVPEVERAVAGSFGHRGGTAVESFVRTVDVQGPAALVLIVPAAPGPWLAQAVATVRGRPGGARVLLGIDGMDEARGSLLSRAFFRGEAPLPGAVRAAELSQVVAAFRGAGAEVILADRVSGRLLTDIPKERKAA